MSSERFSIIVADPPWQYCDKKLNRGGAAKHYRTMSIDDIKKINVSAVAADDCLLMLWATAPLLPEAIKVIEAWGFKYKTVGFVWVKRSKRHWFNLAKVLRKDIAEFNFLNVADLKADLKGWFGDKWIQSRAQNGFAIGMGSYTRANAEFVLFAVKGKAASLIKSHGVRQIIDSPVANHSRKPDDFYTQVEKLTGEATRLELFARNSRDNWCCLGDELSKPTHKLNQNFQIVEGGE